MNKDNIVLSFLFLFIGAVMCFDDRLLVGSVFFTVIGLGFFLYEVIKIIIKLCK